MTFKDQLGDAMEIIDVVLRDENVKLRVMRCASIMDALATGPCSLDEVSKRCDIPRSACHRALLSLKANGVVDHLNHGTWCLSTDSAVVTSELEAVQAGIEHVRKERERAAIERKNVEVLAQLERRAEAGRKLHQCITCTGLVKELGRSCAECKTVEADVDRTLTEGMWASGFSIREMADVVGISSNSMGVKMVRGRQAGWDLPYRRPEVAEAIRRHYARVEG